MSRLSEEQAGLQFPRFTSVAKSLVLSLLIVVAASNLFLPGRFHAQSISPGDSITVMRFTYYSTKGNWEPVLTMNNTIEKSFTASVTLYALDGTSFSLPDVVLPSLGNTPLRLKDFAASAGESFQEGSVEVRFNGPLFGIGAQLTISDGQGRSFDMEPAMGFKSSRLEGLWWSLDDKTNGQIMLTNTSDHTLDASLNLEWKGSVMLARSVNLSARQTSVVDIKQLLNGLRLTAKGIERGGISIAHSGQPGDLIAHGVVQDRLGRFASNLNFVDPAAQPATPLEASVLMIAHPSEKALQAASFFTPLLALKNAADVSQTATVTVQYTSNSEIQSKRLPVVNLAPHEVRMVDFSALLNKLRGASVESAGLKIETNRQDASLIAQLTSLDQNQRMCMDVPLERIPAGFTGKGGHPFHLDGDNQAVVHLKNLSDSKTTAIFQVLYGEEEFSPELIEIGPGQTIAVDVRQMRDSQAEDVHGHRLPPDLEHGQVQWFQNGKQTVIGRLISFSPSRGVSANFACPTFCCPPDYLSSQISPSPIEGEPGSSVSITVTQRKFSFCSGRFYGPYNVTSQCFIYSSNPNVAQVSGSTVQLIASGTAQINADFTTTGYSQIDGCPNPNLQSVCPPSCLSFDVPITASTSVSVVQMVTISAAKTVMDGDQASFSVTTQGATPNSYQWSFTFPSGSGNSPGLTLTGQGTANITATGKWFALPNSACGASPNSSYTIKCTVNFSNGKTKSAQTTLTVNGYWNPGGETKSATIAGGPIIGQDSTSHLWVVKGPGNLTRVLPTPTIYVSSTSQFYFKTVEHENQHVRQWQSGMFSDLLTVAGLMSVWSTLSDPTEAGLRAKLNSTGDSWFTSQEQIYNSRLKAAEREAYMVSDQIAPRFLYQNCGRF